MSFFNVLCEKEVDEVKEIIFVLSLLSGIEHGSDF
jgi:hypothetical protein